MSDRTENLLLLAPGLFLLAAAFFLPIGQMLVLSVSGPDGPTLGHFARFLGDAFYLGLLWRTVRLSLIITVICAAIGFPLAYIMAHVGPRQRLWLIILVILPLMTSVVIRSFGWMVLLSRSGLVPELLRDLGLAGRGFALMNTEAAIVIGMVQVLLPFMALSILGVISRIDRRLEEAARTMGCSFLEAVRSVVLPLALPGIVAGSLLVFIPVVGEFVIPELLGGPDTLMIGRVLWNEFFANRDWPVAAAVAIAILLLLVVPIMLFQAAGARGAEAGR
jgi:putative spermidine/putrescine transport system permease protein